MTQAQRQAFVDTHNQLRNQVAGGQQAGQPGATNMQAVVWNTELEQWATNWAQGCPTSHRPTRYSQQGFYFGENIYWQSNTPATLAAVPAAATQAWYNEVSYFSSSGIASFQAGASGSTQTGHYTQVVWGATNQIGCGMATCSNGVYVVCNYMIGGNMIGSPMYTTGTPSCGSSKSTQYSSLCLSSGQSTAVTATVAATTCPAAPSLACSSTVGQTVGGWTSQVASGSANSQAAGANSWIPGTITMVFTNTPVATAATTTKVAITSSSNGCYYLITAQSNGSMGATISCGGTPLTACQVQWQISYGLM